MRRFFLVLIAAIAVSGCASSGSRYDQSAIVKIKPSVTTETQLESWFGRPFQRERLDSGREKITWQYTKVSVGVGITEQHELLVTMRADGKVESFEERNK